MSSAAPSGSSPTFVKGFLPGLIVGLLVGLAVGAFVVPLLDQNRLPDAAPGGVKRTGARERDERPAGEPMSPPAAPAETPQSPVTEPAPLGSPAPATEPPKPAEPAPKP
jgi:hypothetical protein